MINLEIGIKIGFNLILLICLAILVWNILDDKKVIENNKVNDMGNILKKLEKTKN